MSLSRMQCELKKRLEPLTRRPDGSIASALRFDAGFCGFDGHFPGNPVVPGVCQIAALELLAAEAAGESLTLAEIEQVKFKTPLRPGERAGFRFTLAPAGAGGITVAGTVTGDSGESGETGNVISRIRLRMERP